MNVAPIERRLRTLALARDCMLLGATRSRTIALITGISRYEVQELLSDMGGQLANGRRPDLLGQLTRPGHLRVKIEASVFAAMYDRLIRLGGGPAEALVTAYRLYAQPLVRDPVASPPADRPQAVLCFDYAFDLVCQTYGTWGTREVSLMLALCPACRSRYLTGLLSVRGLAANCPFCRLRRRYACDPHIRALFDTRAARLPSPGAHPAGPAEAKSAQNDAVFRSRSS